MLPQKSCLLMRAQASYSMLHYQVQTRSEELRQVGLSKPQKEITASPEIRLASGRWNKMMAGQAICRPSGARNRPQI